MNEFNMMSSMMTRLVAAFDWLGHLFIAFMFVVAIWKPQRIFNYTAFRLAVVLFATSIITPSVVDAFWNLYQVVSGPATTAGNSYTPSSRGGSSGDRIMMHVTQISIDAARILMGMAVSLGILSLLEPPYLRKAARETPSRDPSTPIPSLPQMPPAQAAPQRVAPAAPQAQRVQRPPQ